MAGSGFKAEVRDVELSVFSSVLLQQGVVGNVEPCMNTAVGVMGELKGGLCFSRSLCAVTVVSRHRLLCLPGASRCP